LCRQFSPIAARKGEASSTGTPLTHGALAVRTSCNIETIGYYERVGILPPAPRSAGGHRLYGEGLVDGGTYTCGEVEKLARDHVREIRRKIADLRGYRGCCGGRPHDAAETPYPIARV